MSLNQLRRAVVAVFVLTFSLASLPVQAWTPVWERPSIVAALGEGTGLLEKLWHFLEGFPGVQEKEGITIDPNGAQGEEGITIDPNGATGDEGITIDPDGAN